jgi:hypothetical protein
MVGGVFDLGIQGKRRHRSSVIGYQLSVKKIFLMTDD